jgi:hypothetical protein
MINSASLTLVIASSITFLAVLYFRFLKSKNKKAESLPNVSAVPTISEEAPKIVTPANFELKFEGFKGRIFKAYVDSLKHVQARTGEFLMPNMTIREYAQVTSAKIGKQQRHSLS